MSNFSTLNVCACPTFGAARMVAKRTACAMRNRLVIEDLRWVCEYLGNCNFLGARLGGYKWPRALALGLEQAGLASGPSAYRYQRISLLASYVLCVLVFPQGN